MGGLLPERRDAHGAKRTPLACAERVVTSSQPWRKGAFGKAPCSSYPLFGGRQVSDQLFLAPSRIHARMASRSQIDNFFLPCGMRTSGEARQSRSRGNARIAPSSDRSWVAHKATLPPADGNLGP